MDTDQGEQTPRWDRRRTIGAVVGGAVVLGIVALLVVGLLNKDLGTSIEDALDEGRRPSAPALDLTVFTAGDGLGPVGSTFALSDLQDRIVVVNVWASWCGPCKDEAPVLERVAARYRDGGGVLVLGVDVEDLSEDARDFIREYGVTYPNARDGSGAARRAFEVRQLPETFVIDRQGRVALKIAGPVLDERQLTNAIEQLKAEGA